MQEHLDHFLISQLDFTSILEIPFNSLGICLYQFRGAKVLGGFKKSKCRVDSLDSLDS